jgi:hypothetical protein
MPQHGLFGSYDTEECAGVRFGLNLADVQDGLGSNNDWANGRYSCALVLTVEFTATTMTTTLEIQTVINCWPRLYSVWIKALVHQMPLVFPWSTVFLGRARQAQQALSHLPHQRNNELDDQKFYWYRSERILMIVRPDAATSNGNVIYKIIRMLYNEVTDILACFYRNHWLLVTASLQRREMSPR